MRSAASTPVDMSLAPSSDGRTFLFVTVGTETFPLSRLVGWIDDWLAGRRGDVRCLVQCGTSSTPRFAEFESYLAYDRFLSELESADIVVSHAGTGSIMLCRRLGVVPIVVPRRHQLGEHVDDHQVAFARRMAGEGEIVLAESRDALFAALDRARADPMSLRSSPRPNRLSESIRRFGLIVDPLLAKGRQRGRR
jgi:UDP-N-acetylglucosamine transferase subunit ALG13